MDSVLLRPLQIWPSWGPNSTSYDLELSIGLLSSIGPLGYWCVFESAHLWRITQVQFHSHVPLLHIHRQHFDCLSVTYHATCRQPKYCYVFKKNLNKIVLLPEFSSILFQQRYLTVSCQMKSIDVFGSGRGGSSSESAEDGKVSCSW